MSTTSEDFDPEYDCVDSLSPPYQPPLPTISSTPTVHASCCLALSSHLLSNLSKLLPSAPTLVLSIGSGSGLIEALLRAEPYNVNVVGVEVQPSVNRYLPSTCHRAVTGTYSIDPLAAEAGAWLFVYPRSVQLVQAYISSHGKGAMDVIMWIGPAADWADYMVCFGNNWALQVLSADELGGRAWETVAVATRKSD